MSEPTPIRIPIFRAGNHRDSRGTDHGFSVAQVRQIAEAYDAKAEPAPVVIGHPDLAAPAFGWIGGLHADENGQMQADLERIEPSFAAQVRSGKYRRVSASFWPPDHPSNPKPGGWYIRHLGFLGAAAPAVSGLPPVDLSADEDVVTLTTDFAAEGDSVPGLLRRVLQLLSPAPAAPTPETTMTQQTQPAPNAPADFAAQEAQLAERAAALARREAEIKAQDDARAAAASKARRDDAVSFAAQLADEGRILPREQAALVEALTALPTQPVSFAGEDGTTTQADPQNVLRGLLQRVQPQIEYGLERSKGKPNAPAAVSFAAPQGAQVDEGRLSIHAKALAYQAQHPGTDYIAAVTAVGG